MSTGKILVVDDEADIRVLLKEILSDEGYDVDVAADAGQAQPGGEAGPDAGAHAQDGGADSVTDVDFEEVK